MLLSSRPTLDANASLYSDVGTGSILGMALLPLPHRRPLGSRAPLTCPTTHEVAFGASPHSRNRHGVSEWHVDGLLGAAIASEPNDRRCGY